MPNYKPFLYLLLFLLTAAHSLQSQNTSPQKILFVGNSYTYFWNLPQNVAAMAESQNIELETRQSTAGGVNLGQHWRGEKGLNTLDIIEKGDFDIIILQDHSMRSIQYPDSLLYYGKLLANWAKKTDAKVYVYMTWARDWNPYMQTTVTEKYTELAEKINAQIVPVGLAWQRSKELRPELNLYDPDGSHPSTIGTYLTACVFYGVLTNQSPVGLPHRLITTDKDNEKLYLNIQSPQDALFLQKVAEEIINEVRD